MTSHTFPSTLVLRMYEFVVFRFAPFPILRWLRDTICIFHFVCWLRLMGLLMILTLFSSWLYPTFPSKRSFTILTRSANRKTFVENTNVITVQTLLPVVTLLLGPQLLQPACCASFPPLNMGLDAVEIIVKLTVNSPASFSRSISATIASI